MGLWKKGERTSRGVEDREFRAVADCAGPMVMALALDGTILYLNPTAERLLGYHASELTGQKLSAEILAPGEGRRMTAELLRLRGEEARPDLTVAERLAAAMDVIGAVPASKIPCFETRCKHKDGSAFPVLVQLSALRNADGTMRGMVMVALDQTAMLGQQQAIRESQERYRDLFENSSEMIATLSPGGQFLYANPAWKRSFGRDQEELLALDSFERVFHEECREQVAELFQDALNGHAVERAPLRSLAEDGRVLDLELSLSRRQKVGNPLAVRCLLRDVTEQRQREHRLALQLAVSQIMAETPTVATAAERVLEVLCIAQEWDLGVLWEADEAEEALTFSTARGIAGLHTEGMIRQSIGRRITSGSELAGQAWEKGRTIYVRDLALTKQDTRVEAALRHGMVSGCAVPVRVGNSVLAVLEFYGRRRVREDNEAMTSVEAVAASLGQMLARTREQGRAEDLTRQQEVLLNAVADGICGLDRRGHVTFANPAAARLLGTAANDLTDRPIHSVLHPTGRCGADCLLLEAIRNAQEHSGETTMTRANGSEFPGEYGITPILERGLERGQSSGSVLSFRDISQRYALDRMKDEFVATAGHELRTPLTAIRGALGLLSSGMLGAINTKAENLLRIALNNSERLIRLINDMLDIERIQHGSEPVPHEPVQLADVVHLAMEGVQPVAEAAGIQLIHDTMQAEICGDADRLAQVVTNLLSNAIKFSPASSTVAVMMRMEENGVTLSVIDQGRGVPEEMLETIFDRFRQVDASDSRQKGGTGLGLSICRTIVAQHGGRIWAERNPVRGTTFRVFFPFRQGETPGPANIVAAGEKMEEN